MLLTEIRMPALWTIDDSERVPLPRRFGTYRLSVGRRVATLPMPGGGQLPVR